MSCGVGRRRGSDLVLLWLWYRPAAVALIGLLAWELPYGAGAALKKKKRKEKRRNQQTNPHNKLYEIGAAMGSPISLMRKMRLRKVK